MADTETKSGNGELWGAGISALGSIAGGAIRGKSAQAAQDYSNKEAQKDRFLSQLAAHGNSLSGTAVPYLNQNIHDLFGAFQDRGPFIADSAGSNPLLDQAMTLAARGSDTSALEGSLGGLRDAYNTDRFNVNAPDALGWSSSLINSPMVNSQIAGYENDISRSLGAPTSNVSEYDRLTGNTGSSTGGIMERIANRGSADRAEDFRAGLMGNALGRAHDVLGHNAQVGAGLLDQRVDMSTQRMGMGQSDLENLLTAGGIQRQLDQTDIDNRIGARDWGLENTLQYGDVLRGQASMGNYIPMPGQKQEGPYQSSPVNSLYGGAY